MKKRVVLLGGESPLGREVRERIEALVPEAAVRLVGGVAKPSPERDADPDDEPGAGLPLDDLALDDLPLEDVPLDAAALTNSAVVVCAADAATARRAWKMAGGDSAPPFVDLSYGLEILPQARLRSALAGRGAFLPEETSVHIIAHPAASALALLIQRLQARHPLRNAIAQIFEPASERGTAGITELQKQVMSLLSFKPLEKRIFDAQLAFNLLARYGEEAPERLEEIEARVERHLATLFAGTAFLPSLRLIQAPVFHGHTISLWLEFENRPDVEDIEADLEAESIEVRGTDVETPSNVGATGQGGVTTGLIEWDRNNPRGVWVWAVADNYRVSADNAAAVVQQILAGNG